MDDVMGRVVIGGEREKVGHVGFGRVVTSLCSIRAMSPVKKPEAEVKFQNVLFLMRNCLDLRLQAGTWGRTESHGGRPILS